MAISAKTQDDRATILRHLDEKILIINNKIKDLKIKYNEDLGKLNDRKKPLLAERRGLMSGKK